MITPPKKLLRISTLHKKKRSKTLERQCGISQIICCKRKAKHFFFYSQRKKKTDKTYVPITSSLVAACVFNFVLILLHTLDCFTLCTLTTLPLCHGFNKARRDKRVGRILIEIIVNWLWSKKEENSLLGSEILAWKLHLWRKH